MSIYRLYRDAARCTFAFTLALTASGCVSGPRSAPEYLMGTKELRQALVTKGFQIVETRIYGTAPAGVGISTCSTQGSYSSRDNTYTFHNTQPDRHSFESAEIKEDGSVLVHISQIGQDNSEAAYLISFNGGIPQRWTQGDQTHRPAKPAEIKEAVESARTVFSSCEHILDDDAKSSNLRVVVRADGTNIMFLDYSTVLDIQSEPRIPSIVTRAQTDEYIQRLKSYNFN